MSTIKTIGQSGQISLGKDFAGRSVIVDEIEPGTWLIKCGTFIPDNERWMHEPKTKSEIDEAIEWAEKTPPAKSRLLKKK